MASAAAARTDSHQLARITGKRGQYGHRFQSSQPAERGRDDSTDVRVRVAQLADQGGDDRGTNRFQDQGESAPLLFDRVSTNHSDLSNGPIVTAPKAGNASRARSWIGSWGLQKSVIVSASSFPCRRDAKI